ncbi:MAG: hypothetical protein H6817_10640 [Phycisphaerales bacterium]|nr:hypothetical protein [Phycisphaerales bacterium]
MTGRADNFASRYLRVVLLSVVLGALIAAIGFLPTRRIAGDAGLTAMLAGCAIAVLAGWGGGLVACQTGGTAADRVNRMLGATALRLVVAAGLAVAAALSGMFAIKPLLLWVAIAYMVTLAGETVLIVRWVKSDHPPSGTEKDSKST